MPVEAHENSEDLDLSSTSQTHSFVFCPYGAPLIALVIEGKATLRSACCNHWECPICGETRARQEYRRIVNGCEIIGSTRKLYFWTLTCRGKELSLEEAEKNYYAWTNTLLTNARTKCKRALEFWCYVQVTERQKKTRAHPHSHIITTFLPSDARRTMEMRGGESLVSAWFSAANASAGLGSQHRISQVGSPAAVARYVAKYMFKDTMRESFPHGWKRVRYSQNFPPAPVLKPDLAIPLLDKSAWAKADASGYIFEVASDSVYEVSRHHMAKLRKV